MEEIGRSYEGDRMKVEIKKMSKNQIVMSQVIGTATIRDVLMMY